MDSQLVYSYIHSDLVDAYGPMLTFSRKRSSGPAILLRPGGLHPTLRRATEGKDWTLFFPIKVYEAGGDTEFIDTW